MPQGVRMSHEVAMINVAPASRSWKTAKNCSVERTHLDGDGDECEPEDAVDVAGPDQTAWGSAST